MLTNPHYEAVRKTVIAACPELMELSFGAKLHRHYKVYGDYSTYYVLSHVGQGRPEGLVWITSTPFGSITLDVSKDEIKNGGEFEIIGHPILLSHVLRTILNQGRYFKLLPIMGEKSLVGIDMDDRQRSCRWNLKKNDLTDQEPNVWKALDKMLSV